ncbi:hypothetical protein KY380_21330, partial [Pseudomonas sp. HD6421]|uniref:hypothetical protein n=1 Tax=Pseudomonas sp. HD6421 TaxID=2860319 RepID=UPI0021BA70D5
MPDITNPKALDKINIYDVSSIIPIASIGIQAQQQFEAEFNKYIRTLNATLIREIQALFGSPKGNLIEIKEKELKATNDLITQKRKIINLAQPASLKFFGRPPLSRSIKQNGVDFVVLASKRRAPRLSVVYKSYVDSLSAAYQVRVATEAISRLQQKATALASDIAAAKKDAARIAAAKAKAEADRIAAAKAKAEADRIAAAKAKAEADRIAAA